MMPEARTTLSSRKKATPPAAQPGSAGAAPTAAASRAAAHHDAAVLQHYQSAVQLLQQAKFDKALIAFEKLLGTAPPPLAERCRMYLTACHRELSKAKLVFSTPEEQYDYAISLLNTGNYEDARDQFDRLLAKNPEADYAHYGLAVLNSITGQAEECLDHLSRAISLNPQNRIQARSDTDFADMADDPRFTELLYPET
jgi:tetratricopeptide (TPR) repeat protein